MSDGNVVGGTSPKTRMKPPLTKFRLGDMFGSTNKELLGFLESVSYSMPGLITLGIHRKTVKSSKTNRYSNDNL